MVKGIEILNQYNNMEFNYEIDVIKLHSKSEQDKDGSLRFYSNGNVRLFLGSRSICSRFGWFTDVAFERVLFKDLHLNFVMNTQFEGEIDDRLHSFYCKYPRKEKVNNSIVDNSPSETLDCIYTFGSADKTKLDGALKFYTNGNIKLAQGNNTICSRQAWFSGKVFESYLLQELKNNFCVSDYLMADILVLLDKFLKDHQNVQHTAEESKTINLNDIVKIKLKPEGVDIYYHQYDELIAKGLLVDRPMPVIDEQGYTKMQLWEVMQLFGHKLSLGADVPFETDIIFEY